MHSARTLLAATAALAALALPATAAAKSDHGGKAHGHTVSVLLRGTYAGGELQVKGGNHAARKAGLVGRSVALDLTSAKLKVRDRNGDGARDAEDLQDGDKVVVQARVARGEAVDDATLAVRKLAARAGSGSQGSDDDPSTDDSSDDPADD